MHRIQAFGRQPLLLAAMAAGSLLTAAAAGAQDESDPASDILPAIPVAERELAEAPPPVARKPRPQAIEEIVVTAQKREESLQSVPISVTALNAEMLKERQVADIGDLTLQVPSLQYGEISGIGMLSIRGVGMSIISGNGENAVAVHQDGIYLAAAGSITLAQEDVGGVEVLRGPQGTLYGRNATGGAINFTSTEPPEDFSIGASALGASYDRRKYTAALGGPVGEDLRVRLFVSAEDRGNHIENTNIDFDYGGAETRMARLAANYQITEALALKLRGFAVEEESNGPIFDPIDPANPYPPRDSYDPDPYRVKTNFAGFAEKKLSGASLKLIYSLADELSLTSITGYTHFQSLQHWDADGTTLPLYNIRQPIENQTFTQEFNLNGSGDALQWLLGAYYYANRFTIVNHADLGQFDQNSFIPIPLPPGLVRGTIDDPSDDRSRSLALFGDLTYSLTDAARIYGGLRLTREKKDFVQTVSLTVQDQRRADCEDLRLHLEDEVVTGRLGAQYDFVEGIMAYAQVATGYKAGAFGTSSCADEVKPEELRAAELGLKSMLLDGALRLNGALYAYQYQNLQFEEIIVPNTFLHNADANIYGGEVELTALLFGIQLDAQIAAARAYYTKLSAKDSLDPDPMQDMDRSGNPLIRMPDWQVALGLQYRFEFGDAQVLTPRVEAMASAGYQTRVYDDPRDLQKRYQMYNAYLNYSLPLARNTFSVRAFGKNLGNSAILGATSDGGNYRVGAYAMPRTYGVELEYRFE
jgi:iron complex outermembrane receptor protein